MAFTEAQVLEALTISMSGAYTKGLGVIKPQWNRVATQVPSSGSSNFYGWLKDLPGIKEWVGERQLAEMGSHGYQIQKKPFEASI
ncbi:MAG: Mu-like prophage major head subunit gpT family protein, partial [Plesiomonas shigelloides]